MDMLKKLGGGSAALAVGVLGGVLGYKFEDAIFGTRTNRTVIAVFIGATSAVGTAYILQDRGYVNFLK